MNHLKRARPLLGTLVEIRASGATSTLLPAIEQAFAIIEEVHALMSYQEPASEISRLNRSAHLSAQEVHLHTWNVLLAAQELAAASEGLFDITIAPTLERIGFLPRHADMPRASRHGDWRHIALLPGQRVKFLRQVRIDVSGIAKGYAVDCALRVLRDAGLTAASVNAGGDLRVFGPYAQPLQVRAPQDPTQSIALMPLTNGAAATSAAYFTQRRHAGQQVTTLIHPQTHQASASPRSVTVLAQDCMLADALTKIVMADAARATPLLQRHQARALLIEHDAERNQYRIFDSQQALHGVAA